jgi:hypothetical protein
MKEQLHNATTAPNALGECAVLRNDDSPGARRQHLSQNRHDIRISHETDDRIGTMLPQVTRQARNAAEATSTDLVDATISQRRL